jgi:hypothetical protein
MERIAALIEKLQKQHAEGASNNYLLLTLHEIQAALLQQQISTENATKSVQVSMPQQIITHIVPTAIPKDIEQANEIAIPPTEKVVYELKVEPEPEVPLATETLLAFKEEVMIEAVTEVPVQKATPIATVINNEVNEKLATTNADLNDKLKTNVVELSEKLDQTKIADLRKAFSINEKFVYTDILFRGDNDMFTRCVNTINNFNSYGEAQAWMERELIIKLGWNRSQEMVKDFFELVERRFM